MLVLSSAHASFISFRSKGKNWIFLGPIKFWAHTTRQIMRQFKHPLSILSPEANTTITSLKNKIFLQSNFRSIKPKHLKAARSYYLIKNIGSNLGNLNNFKHQGHNYSFVLERTYWFGLAPQKIFFEVQIWPGNFLSIYNNEKSQHSVSNVNQRNPKIQP